MNEQTRSLGANAREWIVDISQRLGYSRDQVRRCERSVAAWAAFASATTIDDLRPISVTRWLADRSVSRKTQLNDLGALRCFCDWLVSVERLTSNPLRGLRMPRAYGTRGCEPFTLEELRRLIAYVTAKEAKADGRQAKWGPLRSTWYTFLARTGLRFDEARKVRWDDIDLGEAIMRVRGKGGRFDVLPIDPETVSTLYRWRSFSAGPKVFGSVPCHKTILEDIKAAGIAKKPGRWHRFRKTAITERAKRGASLRVMCQFARHNDPKTTANSYDFVRLDEIRAAANLLPTIYPQFAGRLDLAP